MLLNIVKGLAVTACLLVPAVIAHAGDRDAATGWTAHKVGPSAVERAERVRAAVAEKQARQGRLGNTVRTTIDVEGNYVVDQSRENKCDVKGAVCEETEGEQTLIQNSTIQDIGGDGNTVTTETVGEELGQRGGLFTAETLDTGPIDWTTVNE